QACQRYDTSMIRGRGVAKTRREYVSISSFLHIVRYQEIIEVIRAAERRRGSDEAVRYFSNVELSRGGEQLGAKCQVKALRIDRCHQNAPERTNERFDKVGIFQVWMKVEPNLGRRDEVDP